MCAKTIKAHDYFTNRELYTFKSGAPGGIRTLDHRFRRPTLYPLSYRRTKRNKIEWGEWRDSNPRSPGPQPGALNLSATLTMLGFDNRLL